MLFYYLKIAFRNLQKNSFYSFINISGLAIGIATALLIALWVVDELSYDSFLENNKNISQLYVNSTFDGKISSQKSSPFPAYLELRQASSKIKNTALANWGETVLLSAGNNKIIKESYHVSKEFLQVLPYPLVSGNVNTALEDPTNIVLTESTAQALFGNEEPLGKFVKVDNDAELKVTGVIKDLPDASTLKFDCLMNVYHLGSWIKSGEQDWSNYSWQIFVEQQPNTALPEIDNSIKNILTAKGQTDLPREFFLHPLSQWHLYTDFENGKPVGGKIDYVKGFSWMALFIISIACFNFMNLATARSESRAKEVGVRKSVGSKRTELIAQFLSESFLVAAFALVLAFILAQLALPFYNDLTTKKLFIDYSTPPLWAGSFLLIVVVGVLSGIYPAFYLSSFNPVNVLKGKIEVGKAAITPRKVLVVLQFSLATFLIIGTIVISRQIEYAQQRDLGYNQENLITMQYTIDLEKNLVPLRQELASTGVVTSMTISNTHVTDIVSQNFVDWEGKPKDQKVAFVTIATEFDYTKTMGVKLLLGRDFESQADSNSVIINKAAMEVMNMKDPIGSVITARKKSLTIVGVIENMVMGNPFRKTSPSYVIFNPIWSNALAVRLEPTSDLSGSLKKIEAVFNKFNPAYPFQYTFVDDKFNKRYAAINLIHQLCNVFMILAFIITGLGLFGLAAMTAQQRTKEIGIRKVMGASLAQLVGLLTQEFLWLVIIAFILIAPVSIWFLIKLLENYPYHISFPWVALLLAGLVQLIFAILVVGGQSLKAAIANPAKSLRSE